MSLLLTKYVFIFWVYKFLVMPIIVLLEKSRVISLTFQENLSVQEFLGSSKIVLLIYLFTNLFTF